MKRPVAFAATVAAIPILASSVQALTPTGVAPPSVTRAAATVLPLTDDPDFSRAATWAERERVRELRRATRSADGVRTYGTRFSSKQAVARLKQWAKQGVGGYPDQCLRLADDAYGASGPRTTTALAQWSRARDAGLAQEGSRDIPVGAQMFWRTSHPAGHIATYVGGGKVVTNMPGGRVEIVDWHKLNEWGPYLGWAPPYYR